MKINILLNNNFFNDHCSYSFAFPIFKSLDLINESGVKINFFYSYKKNIFEGDILIIDSRYCCKQENRKQFIDNLKKNKVKDLKIIFADTADNSGQIKTDFLSLVDVYWKGQILKNKKEYMKPHYGGRLFTHYYNKRYKIKDSKKQFSEPVKDKKLLKKIKISWNMGLCDYGKLGHIKQKLFSIFKSKMFINNSRNYFLPNSKRKFNLCCRIGTDYQRETVQFQRKRISGLLKRYVETSKIPRFKYLNEIKISKYVISPFGWGELCPRDFETFIYGAILIKPDMKTIDTWPDWYISKKTYLSLKWDFSDFKDQINFAINNYNKLIKLGINAQKKYLFYTTSEKSKQIFAERFIKLIKN